MNICFSFYQKNIVYFSIIEACECSLSDVGTVKLRTKLNNNNDAAAYEKQLKADAKLVASVVQALLQPLDYDIRMNKGL